MLTQEENANLVASVDLAIGCANRMLRLINSIENNKEIVVRIISERRSKSISEAKSEIQHLIAMTQKLQSFKSNITFLKTLDSDISDGFRTHLQ